MIGVTLSSPGFEDLAHEAKRRFRKYTGLNVVVVETSEDQNYTAKLDLPSMFNQTVVYFDADLWFIQHCDLSGYDDQEEFLAVRDPGIHDPSHFPFHDCRTLKIDLMKYFNTGFFIFNNRHREAFKAAARVMSKRSEELKDFGEQSSLNYGVQTHCKVKLITNSFNYMPFAEIHRLRAMEDIPDPLAIHVAGYGPELKKGALEFFEAFYSRKYAPHARLHNHPR